MTPIMNLHNVDVSEFLAVLDTCEGNVYLVTNEGDRLNLRSKLCQADRGRQNCRGEHLLREQERRK